jgi:hypothetical protein
MRPIAPGLAFGEEIVFSITRTRRVFRQRPLGLRVLTRIRVLLPGSPLIIASVVSRVGLVSQLISKVQDEEQTFQS